MGITPQNDRLLIVFAQTQDFQIIFSRFLLRAISPMTAIDAIVGLNDLMRASRMKGVRASLGDAPFPNR